MNPIFLARMKRRNRLPGDRGTLGPPNGSLTRYENGEICQIRYYDSEGRPIKDIDYSHDHNQAGNPHAHDWDYKTPKAPNKTRFEARPLTDEECKEIENLHINTIRNDNMPKLHDEKIFSVYNNCRKDIITMVTNNYVVKFISVLNLSIQDFWIQNVIFSFSLHDTDTIPPSFFESYSIKKEYKTLHKTIALIESSIGLYGWVVCDSVKISARNRNKKPCPN